MPYTYIDILKKESTKIIEDCFLQYFLNYPQHFEDSQNSNIERNINKQNSTITKQEDILKEGKTRIKEEIEKFLAFQILVIRLHTLSGEIQENLKKSLEDQLDNSLRENIKIPRDITDNINQININIEESNKKINKLPKIENTIEEIKEEINKLAKIENNIVERLTNKNSPLCTKEAQSELNIKVAKIEGKLSSSFWMTISTTATTIISIIGGILLIYSKIIPANIT